MKTFFFQDLAAKYNVVLKNNAGQDSSVLNVYCKTNKIHLIDNIMDLVSEVIIISTSNTALMSLGCKTMIFIFLLIPMSL